ncbi:MAG: hypothetical protein Q9171_005601 [Xanthocarpia ochracea]
MSSLQQQQLLTACADGDIPTVRHVLSTLPPSAAQDIPLKAMALKAAENGHADILELCIDQGADVSDLKLEAAEASDQVLKVLITKAGLDVNQDWETGGDMLINAVWERKFDFTKWLLEHGADPNSGHLMADSTTALTAAAQQGRIDLSELLVQHNATLSGSGALAGAAENKHIDMVRWLLDRGAEIDETGIHDYGDRRKKEYEGTALHKAAANGDVEMAKLLVERGANLHIKDPMDRTPLMRALGKNQREVAEYFRSVQGDR